MAASKGEINLEHIYAPSPVVTRGQPTVLNGDPKGKNMLYGCGANVIIRDVKNPLEADIYQEHAQPVNVAQYCPSGFYIASGDAGGNIRIWDTVNIEHILKNEYRSLSGAINDLAWSEDNQRIVIGGNGRESYGTAILAEGGTTVGVIDFHNKQVLSIDMKPNRPYRVATGSEDAKSNFYSGPPFKFTRSNEEHTRFVNCVRFSKDGSKYISVAADKKGIIYDGKTGERIGELSADGAHTGGIYGAAWSPDSQQILTVSGDKTAKIWDANTYACLTTFKFGGEKPTPDHQQLGCLWQGDDIISLSLDGTMTYLDPANPDTPKRVVRGHNKNVTALAYDSANNQLISADFGGLIIAWNVGTPDMTTFTGAGHTNQISSLALNGESLFSAGMDDSVRVTPLKTKAYGTTVSMDSPCVGVACGKKDTGLAVAVCSRSIALIRDGAVVQTITTDKEPLCADINPSENEVAVGCKDGIRLFSLEGNALTEVVTLTKHRGQVTDVKYSPDGSMLASCDVQRDIFIWTVAGAKTECKVDSWCFHSARPNSLAWSPNNVNLASVALDGDLFIWNVNEPQNRLRKAYAGKGGIQTVVFLDETTVATAGADCAVKTWKIKF